jgi:hypothetical protein
MIALFSTKRTKDPSTLSSIATHSSRPAAPPHVATRTAPIWSMEEDEMLQSLTRLYQGNWNAIASHVNSSQKTPCQPKSPWDCYSRFSTLDKMALTTTGGSPSPLTAASTSTRDFHHAHYHRHQHHPYYPSSQLTRKESALRQKNLRLESKKKMARHYLSLDHFRKALHYRTSATTRPYPPLATSKKTAPSPPSFLPIHPPQGSRMGGEGPAATNVTAAPVVGPTATAMPTPLPTIQGTAFSRKSLNPLEVLLRTRQRLSPMNFPSHDASKVIFLYWANDIGHVAFA